VKDNKKLSSCNVKDDKHMINVTDVNAILLNSKYFTFIYFKKQ